ncbi:Xaa-Pro aminopeptidase [Natranaerovirga pectinivora]|uniref:Xaa-Pro aminopeptidase n=1 Tax=Natranaerovirga pectinivora TaxID=682400 RepID=A0A4V2V0M2_9FIRM|nr:aminopeptidase P family protein [Natranaerovirga pectinivora]TCT16909.1 Xaa-Pro aminopeptidase [Natranaerovirga pectinivora]
MSRIKKLIKKLEKNNLDAMIIHNGLNRRYLSGFTGSTAYLYISKNKQIILTDFRYMEQATNECKDFEVVDMLAEGHIATFNKIIQDDNIESIGFEQNTVTYQEFAVLEDGLKIKKLVPISDMVESLRMVKEEEEIENIRKAVSIGDKAFDYILDVLKPGISEKEIALELEFFMKKEGASKLSFDSIVASGVHSSMPHASPSDKKIESGDFVTLDFGCVYKGYCSDMTRTMVIGKANEKQKEIYNTVLEAQLKAISTIKEGISGIDADKVARDLIKEKGYGEYFGHGLGHAVGLYIHESPRLSPLGHDTLEENMVVTVEPGIYVPKFGGVRIEDIVIVKKDGVINLTKSPKELIEL